MVVRIFADQSILNRLTNTAIGKDLTNILWPNILLNCTEAPFSPNIGSTSIWVSFIRINNVAFRISCTFIIFLLWVQYKRSQSDCLLQEMHVKEYCSQICNLWT